MMKYEQSVAQSAEYLRLALPLMSKQAAAFHPVSYAVWYEYVAGINLPLRKAIDGLAGGAALDEATTAELFRRHIAELDEETAQRVGDGVERVLADMSRSAADAGHQATHFGLSLAQLSEGLGDHPTTREWPDVVSELLRETHTMQASIGTLQERLDESRREIATLREEVSRAREDALGDTLTGLVNRRGFDLALLACLAVAGDKGRGPSVLMADLDHFKQINDSYGHLFGDKVLRAVAHILKQNVKGKDTAARFGGEEFVILLPDTPIDGARRLAEAIRVAVEGSQVRRSDTQQPVGRITVSLGVASHLPGESADELLRRADDALYAAKRHGRNRVTLAAV